MPGELVDVIPAVPLELAVADTALWEFLDGLGVVVGVHVGEGLPLRVVVGEGGAVGVIEEVTLNGGDIVGELLMDFVELGVSCEGVAEVEGVADSEGLSNGVDVSVSVLLLVELGLPVVETDGLTLLVGDLVASGPTFASTERVARIRQSTVAAARRILFVS
eukprot:gb/GECG01007836.1/.p1 GENE.gb/GECG01007836.1/~~gb/GECG01007836.1/.p1  ORF type:complete len:162 (+),score=17.91 gb/GECG01007836.1/:1-486(+)